MRILIVTPASRGSRLGNRVTASRWARLLRSLGHSVTVSGQLQESNAELLIALHARKSARAIRRFREAHPRRQIVLAMTGTDLYKDLPRNKAALQSIQLADRLVLLQPDGRDRLPASVRDRACVIFQSASPPDTSRTPLKKSYEFAVIGHLRPVKDPFRAPSAARLLPASSRILITHFGAALSKSMKQRAEGESARNPRYRWRGSLPAARVRRHLSGCQGLLITSRSEGGPNVVCEAVVAGVPVISSRISGVVGMLGKDYPGYFPYGDTTALADLMARCEQDSRFHNQLRRACLQKKPLFSPQRERAAWANLLREL